MSSGAFPLSGKDAEKLEQVVKLLCEVNEEWDDCLYTGDSGGLQFDNAASDGGYLARLGIARKLIEDCID